MFDRSQSTAVLESIFLLRKTISSLWLSPHTPLLSHWLEKVRQVHIEVHLRNFIKSETSGIPQFSDSLVHISVFSFKFSVAVLILVCCQGVICRMSLK